MDKRHRYIYFFDLKVETHSTARNIKKCLQQSISAIFSVVHASNPKGRHYSYQKDTLHFYIADWHFDTVSNQYHILVNKSDRNSANPTFTDVPNKKRREIAKEDGEGLDHSSHITLRLVPEQNHKVLLLLERGALVGSYHLQALFNRLISDARHSAPDFFVQNHPDGEVVKGEPKKMNMRYSVEVDGHMSDNFEEDLSKGSFREVELITDTPSIEALDTSYMPTQKTETIKLKPNKNFSLTDLKKLVSGKSQQFEKARVRFKHPNGTDRDIEINTENFSETNYVKRAKIESLSEFKSSYEVLDVSTIKLMKALS